MLTMNSRQTRHQVARSARPDAEQFNRMYLVKIVSKLRATYQIRLLAFKAVDTKTKLILKVPKSCEFDESLNELIKICGNAVIRDDF
jgi:hypothetical protein